MNRLYKLLNKGAGNRGFSLIELIIVVAIMAVLIGILAPQYLKYVEKSRVSADKTSLDELQIAAQVLLADPDSNWNKSDEFTGTAGDLTLANSNSEIKDIVGSTVKLKSTNGKLVTKVQLSGAAIIITGPTNTDYKTW